MYVPSGFLNFGNTDTLAEYIYIYIFFIVGGCPVYSWAILAGSLGYLSSILHDCPCSL